MARRYWLAVAVLTMLVGCSGEQAALRPAGRQAEQIANLFSLYQWICTLVYLITMAVILVAVWRRFRHAADQPEPPETLPNPTRERRHAIVVSAAVAMTTIILFVFMISDYATGRALAGLSGDQSPLKIRVTGHQWWWELTYEDPDPHNWFTDANEIHIPVGRTVQLELSSGDVIHSFWVPRLAGKKDLIPGHGTSIYLRADKPGMYFGQCAEFCGYEHALMRLLVIAQTPEEFFAWQEAARRPAPQPIYDIQKRGQDVFLSNSCVMCHTISGTRAGGRVGPNLTHIASRKYLASNTIPNVTGHLAGWIVDPQKIKPGVRMPQNSIPPHDLRALLEYLEMLK